ncbi:unnamed protein product [Adineta steineri]|uniref:Uncharacterized protein n=1 Tax=Adineta steineri TaxID=433720 RepID=A0A815F628_9BILA|nr:unnamed protein product [Adineta steineri]CAF1584764.1 unnamed protein product [Adineta steineri]
MNRMILIITIALVMQLLICNVSATSVTISNILPRLDIEGKPMDIHDGNIIQYEKGGLYYYYGAGYGECHPPLDFGCAGFYLLGDCGFRENHTIYLYTSPDLHQWTFVRDIFPWNGGRPLGIYYRPKVIYNRYTQLYVLWINRVERTGPFGSPNFLNASYIVATSKTPDGVFTVVQEKVQSIEYGNPGDFTLFIDNDDEERPTAYLAYNSFNNLHRIQIEQLTVNYTATLGKNSTTGPLTPTNNEAPIMFKRNDYYYLLFGQCCCFCTEGSNSRVFVSTHPMGPWVDTQYDIDPVTNEIVHGILRRRSISGGQESFVVQALQTNGTEAFIFVSDRWGTGKQKANDMQYWQPLQFDDTQSPPRIQKLNWTDQFTIDLQS